MVSVVKSWSEGNKLSLTEARALGRFLLAYKLEHDLTQVDMEGIFGVTQGLLSRMLKAADVRNKSPYVTTRGRVGMMSTQSRIPMADMIGGGTDSALGSFEAEDILKPRGQALDALSSAYGEEFLRAAIKLPAKAGSDSWTTEEWLEYLVDLRKAWKNGFLSLPGIVSPSDQQRSAK